eukprot:jgi/Ulvmu1/7392/UM036_0052.1
MGKKSIQIVHQRESDATPLSGFVICCREAAESQPTSSCPLVNVSTHLDRSYAHDCACHPTPRLSSPCDTKTKHLRMLVSRLAMPRSVAAPGLSSRICSKDAFSHVQRCLWPSPVRPAGAGPVATEYLATM